MTIIERFTCKINKTETCWLWIGAINGTGYGSFSIGSRKDGSRTSVLAHRFSYELFKGEIPDDLCLDHLCRVRNCVNPDHLEPVTNAENLARGANATKTHCKYGHIYDDKNTIFSKGSRLCKQCFRDRNKRYYKQKKLAQSVHPKLTYESENEPKIIMKDEIFKTEGDL